MIVFAPPPAPPAALAAPHFAPRHRHAIQRAVLLVEPSMPFPAPVGKAVVRLDAMTDTAIGPGFSVGGDMGFAPDMSLADLREGSGFVSDTDAGIVSNADAGVALQDTTIDNLPPALRDRYNACVAAGGVFDPNKNRCCSVSWDGSIECNSDPLERVARDQQSERNQAVQMLAGAAVVGALVVGTGLYFGLRRSS